VIGALLVLATVLSSPPAERGAAPGKEALAITLPALPAQRGERSGEGALARLAWDDEGPGWAEDDEPRRPHVLLSAWAGEAFATGGSGRSSSFFAGAVDHAFEHFDLGVQGAAYRSIVDATRPWTPVALLRLTQRFHGRRGAELAFGFGVGAGHPAGWTAWYQLTLGVRIPLGPIFLGGELAFEPYDLLRLGGGLGVAF
jgi:hypothetical protein